MNSILQNPYVFVSLVVWELSWRGLALWKCAQRKHIYFFIPLLVINSAGILSIIYLAVTYFIEKRKLKKIT